MDRKTGDYAVDLTKSLGKARLDASFNAVGGTTFKKDLKLLGSGGKLVLFGGAERGAGGAFGTLRFVWNMGLVIPIFLMMQSKSLIGVNMLRLSEHKPLLVSACMQAALGFARWSLPKVLSFSAINFRACNCFGEEHWEGGGEAKPLLRRRQGRPPQVWGSAHVFSSS